MAELIFAAPVRRFGNSLAVIIPAEEAKRAGILEGTRVAATLRPQVPSPLGMLKDLKWEPYAKWKKGLWRDRI